MKFHGKAHLVHLGAAAAALAMAGLVACGGGGGSGGTGDGQLTGVGTLSVALADAPACGYDHVYVTVDRVRVHKSGTAADGDSGWTDLALATPKRIDLLTLTNGVMEELGQTQLPSGTYSQVRLVLVENGNNNQLANAVQPSGGALVALNTPSAQQSGLKLRTSFEVRNGQTSDLLLDFDACRSVVVAGASGGFNLKPVLTVSPRVSTAIQGYVSTALSPAGTLVTAQQGGVVVRSATPDSSGRFVLSSLATGSYDVVVTSDNRSTAVVPGVPVTGTATTTINGTATAILPPAATMRVVSGITSVTTTGTAATALVTDATVRATQALTGGPAVEVTRMSVNATTAAYQLRVPAAPPVKATFSAGSALNFGADTAVGGNYRIEAAAPGRATVQAVTDVGTSDQTVNPVFAP